MLTSSPTPKSGLVMSGFSDHSCASRVRGEEARSPSAWPEMQWNLENEVVAGGRGSGAKQQCHERQQAGMERWNDARVWGGVG
mmetsp:Transcript_76294/g.204960  ORF Transcript_76294/g.204960 Transcript_76294/m.204960 type:complete len:83 (+) Transcript_76294:587-835(+)